MSYHRDFIIGLRETQDFYLSLSMRHWRKGIAGFALAGALAGLLYTSRAGMPWYLLAAVMLAAAAATAVLVALVLTASTLLKVKDLVKNSGRESYVQETEINGFGVHVTVGKDKAKLGFPDLMRVQETRKAFYLFLSDSQAWILPKKQMEDPQAECARLRELFTAVIERNRLRLKG